MQLRLYSIFDKQPSVPHLFHICTLSPSQDVSFFHLQSSNHQTSNNSGEAELDPAKEGEKAFEEKKENKEIFKRTFYENEAVNITLDYVKLLNKEKVAKAK